MQLGKEQARGFVADEADTAAREDRLRPDTADARQPGQPQPAPAPAVKEPVAAG